MFGDDGLGALGVIFHHTGLLTGNPAAAAKVLSIFGYHVDDAVTDHLQDVDLRMAHGTLGAARIEIITPRSPESPLAHLLRRRDDYMYHSCFVATNVQQVVSTLTKESLRVTTLSAAKPAVLFDGAMVSFYAVDGLGVVEFIEHGT